MYIVSFALILAVRYTGKLYDLHLVNVSIVVILVNSVSMRRKEGFGQSTCCI